MTQLIRHLTSLSNLERMSVSNPRGQIATLLILVIVIMLIFVLVLANLGNVATNSTTIANAADNAALLLGSHLSTKARILWEALGHKPEVCVKGGFLAMFIAIILVVIMIILIIFVPPVGALIAALAAPMVGGMITASVAATIVTTVAGAVIGAAGGAAGGAIAGTGAAEGALQGAQIGAAIGSMGAGLSGGLGLGASFSSTGATTAAGMFGGEALGALTTVGAMTTTGAITLGVSGALSMAASVYNQSEAESETGKNMKDMADMMNKLDEPTRIRESVLLQALEQVVDDPHKTQDWNDVNLNGNTSEILSDFSIWYFKRLGSLTTVVRNTTPLLSNFLNSVGAFAGAAFNANGYNNVVFNTTDGSVTSVSKTAGPGDLEKADYALNVGNGQAIPNPAPNDFSRDGAVALLLRALYPSYKAHITNPDPPHSSVEAWQPGPTPDALNAYGDVGCDANGSCGTCDSNGNCSVAAQAPLPGYDYVDSISDGLVYMAQFMGVFQTRSASDLTMTWENWIGYFFDEGSYNSDGTLMPGATPDPEAYYEKLGTYVALLTQLKNQIINIRDSQIPACFEGYWISGVCAAGGCPAGHWATDAFGNTWWECDVPTCSPNPPCRFSDGVGTIDQERANDEFVNAITAINNQIAQMNIFRSAIMNLFIGMKAAEAAALASCTPPGCCATPDCSSQSCAEYCWTDTRGDHHVLVQLGAYNIPIIKVKKTGNFLMNKTCNYIWPEGWRSGGNMDESQCSVTITRVDPTKSLGPLGYWNPFAWPITKKAWAYYKWDRVGLK